MFSSVWNMAAYLIGNAVLVILLLFVAIGALYHVVMGIRRIAGWPDEEEEPPDTHSYDEPKGIYDWLNTAAPITVEGIKYRWYQTRTGRKRHLVADRQSPSLFPGAKQMFHRLIVTSPCEDNGKLGDCKHCLKAAGMLQPVRPRLLVA